MGADNMADITSAVLRTLVVKEGGVLRVMNVGRKVQLVEDATSHAT